MATTSLQCLWLLIFLSFNYLLHSSSISHVYIVYLGGVIPHHDPTLTCKSHLQLLANVFQSEEDANQSILYSYKHGFSGFSAKLNSTQAAALAKMEGVISVFRSKTLHLHTTRSWDFMGLTLSLGNVNTQVISPFQLAYGGDHDIIVGLFDTGVGSLLACWIDQYVNLLHYIYFYKVGIWPESESFQEEAGMGPIPSSWNGECAEGEDWPSTTCNRKLIGARYYLNGFEQEFGECRHEYRSARDFLGHGTHTASTAVGSVVKNASFFGLAQGTARGGAPRARLAVYKICWGTQDLDSLCSEADIMAAFDDALQDGVHVISVSVGAAAAPLSTFFDSHAAIGSFHAMQLGVSVVFSAGNDGPDPSLVKNVSPWSLCVAASTIDRTFSTKILIDNSISIMGEGFITTRIRALLADPFTYFNDSVCATENWKHGKWASGKVILCFSTIGGVTSSIAQLAAKKANASGLIFVDTLTHQIPDPVIIPTVLVDIIQGTKMRHYLRQSKFYPKLQIGPSKTVIGKSPAPTVAYFSSRGPSSLSPDILKPDIIAPGVNILAAWPPKTPPAFDPHDKRSVEWNFQSGTSMSCPHVSGIVALIKSAHPHWSPAAIKSAVMTTAYTRDTTYDSILAGGSMKESDPFDIGAGHINPLKALDPGLVYDMKTRDYVLFLCNIGYTQQQIKKLVNLPSHGTDTCCPPVYKSNANINYPSITISNLQSTTTIKRTVRNVGLKKLAIYYAHVVSPNGVEVMVWPKILIFSCFKEEMSYYVTLKPHKKSQGRYDFGQIVWSDGFHFVRSPIVVSVNTTIV